jgi:hypothetical protein
VSDQCFLCGHSDGPLVWDQGDWLCEDIEACNGRWEELTFAQQRDPWSFKERPEWLRKKESAT